MNRKSNPWVALVALILLLVLVVCTCTGCADRSKLADAPDQRFRVVSYLESGPVNDVDIYIIEDTETGVRYLYVNGYHGVGLTKLEEGE